MYTCEWCGREFTTRSNNKRVCSRCIGKRGGKVNAWPAVIKPKVAKCTREGYLYYTSTMLTVEEKSLLPDDGRTILVHRLVIATHLGRPLVKGEVVMHVNGNKYDNRIVNLQIGSPKENSRQHWDALVASESWKRLAVLMLLAFSYRS